MKTKLAIPLCLIAVLLMIGCGGKSTNTEEAKNESDKTETLVNEEDNQDTPKKLISDATFNFENITESKEETGVFPFVSDLPEFKDNKSASVETKDSDFDRILFYDGKGLIPFEGKLHYRKRIINDSKDFSAHKVLKSFEDMFQKMGAVKVFSGDARDHFNEIYSDIPKEEHQYLTRVGGYFTSLYLLKKGDAHIVLYLSVDGNYGGTYDLYVMQAGDLNQTLNLITASEMKKELDSKGSVTLYINFDTDKADIKSESEPIINEINTLLKDNSTLKVSINGYTDNVGTVEHNQKLSEARAKSVVDALVKKGISKTRLQSKGFGQNDPIADNRTEEGREKNRRVEIVKIK